MAQPKLGLVMDSCSNYSNKEQHLGLPVDETDARTISRYFSSSTRPDPTGIIRKESEDCIKTH